MQPQTSQYVPPQSSGTGAARLAPCQEFVALIDQEPAESCTAGWLRPALVVQIASVFVPLPSPVKTCSALAEKQEGTVNLTPRSRFGPPMLTRSLKLLPSFSTWQGDWERAGVARQASRSEAKPSLRI